MAKAAVPDALQQVFHKVQGVTVDSLLPLVQTDRFEVCTWRQVQVKP